MKRSRIVIGIFIALILVVLAIVLLACTVFVVRDISVEAAVSSRLINEEKIVESSGISKGDSIISLGKSRVAANIEKANPYVEVTGISREFPSKVVIKVTVRTGIMLVCSEDESGAAVVDSSMKVLNVVPYADRMKTGVTLVDGVRFKVPEEGAFSTVGTTLEFTNPSCGTMLSEIAIAAEDPSLFLSGTSFRTLFKEIDFVTGEGIRAYIKTNKGVTLVLDSTLESTVFEQLYKCMFVLASDETSDFSRGYIALDTESKTVAFKWMESLD